MTMGGKKGRRSNVLNSTATAIKDAGRPVPRWNAAPPSDALGSVLAADEVAAWRKTPRAKAHRGKCQAGYFTTHPCRPTFVPKMHIAKVAHSLF